MSKFKIGDEVNVNNKIGKIVEIDIDDQFLPYYIKFNECDYDWYDESYLELITEPKTLENLDVGDKIIKTRDGRIRTVHAVTKAYIFYEDYGSISTITVKELEKLGYKPFTQQTTVIDGKTYILNDKLAKAIEEAESI